jgi:lambda repressor-like predicted transcriptional regulator
MARLKTISEWLSARGMSLAALAESAGLEPRIVEAIALGRYTSSPQQRQRLADALGVSPDEVRWGQAVPVDPMYGHGPQFGRSP